MLTMPTDASSVAVTQHRHLGTSMPSRGVHPIAYEIDDIICGVTANGSFRTAAARSLSFFADAAKVCFPVRTTVIQLPELSGLDKTHVFVSLTKSTVFDQLDVSVLAARMRIHDQKRNERPLRKRTAASPNLQRE
jgi:hypothetical protein